MPSRSTLVLPLVLAALLAPVGCGGADDDPAAIRQSPQGLFTAESRFDYATTVARLDSVLQLKPPIRIAARIDHAANAEAAGRALRPTTVVLFGSPTLGTPLMHANRQVALDLPQKALVYETPDGRAVLVYNGTDYLAQRHGVGAVETLRPMRAALRGLAKQVTRSAVTAGDTAQVGRGAGIVEVASDASVEATVQRLQAAIDQREALSMLATVDHAANAAQAGLDLPPTRLVVVGNPPLGTPLMQDAPTMALDLPQKMLVYEADGGGVRIAYNDPFFLADRHVLTGHDERLQTIADALAGLAEQAAGE